MEKKLKKFKTFHGEPITVCPIDWKAALDIDDYEDLEMAKALYNLYGK